MYPSFVARFDEQLHISIHKRNSHRYGRTIWQNKIWILTELLDHTKDIIPSTAIEASTVIAELIDDLYI